MTVLGRHAVVIIHGIGEQAPLSTVRGFVGRRTPWSRGEEARGGIVSPADRVFAEPSPIGARSDELLYSVTTNHSDRAERLASTGWRVQERAAVTEFYEFYWASRYRGTRMGHLTGWIYPVLRRRLGTFSSPRLRGPDGPVRALPFVAVILALAGVGWSVAAGTHVAVPVAVLVLGLLVALVVGTFLGLIATVRVLALCTAAAVVGTVLIMGFGPFASIAGTVGSSALVAGLGTWAATAATKTLGDAARYLAPDNPDNVEENEAVRTRVLALLTELREVKDPDTGRPRYDRVVVVGHSLGSVIAYDAVRLLWARTHREVTLPATSHTGPAADALRELESTGVRLSEGESGASPDPSAWHAAQRAAGLVIADADRRDGPRWNISDLITLGCPLTYADAFMGTSAKDLEDRFVERSLAANPPVRQQVRRAASHPYRLWVPGPDGGTTHFHHAAPFATVRWTNAWFEHDIVGGPVGPHFGPGVRDVSLGGTRWLAGMAFAYPHSSYWVAGKSSRVREGSELSRGLLRDAIQRRPTLLLTARSPLDDDALVRLTDLLTSRAADPPETVDVRLYVGATDADRRGSYLPLETIPLPAHDLVPEIKAVLGTGSRVALLASPDVLEPATAPPGVDTEPDEVDERVGEELEAVGELVDEEFEVVGEEE